MAGLESQIQVPSVLDVATLGVASSAGVLLGRVSITNLRPPC